MAQAALALGIAETLDLSAVVAPVLTNGELVADVQMLEHELMVWEAFPTSQHRAFSLLVGCHLVAGIALDGGPDDEAV